MLITEHALSLDAPGMEMPGLITGRITVTTSGRFRLEYITRAPDEGTAFARALRFPSEAIANAVMDELVRLLPPGGSLRRIEITRSANAHELVALADQGRPLSPEEARTIAASRDPATGVETYGDGAMFHHPV